MTEPGPVHSSQIDRHLERMLSNADEVGLPLVREVLDESGDRWYGQLVVNMYDSLSDRQDSEPVIPAAAGIELLRGYIRLRSRLLVRLTDNHAHSLTLEPTSALLAGDYLYSAAFSALHSVTDTRSDDCFEILATAFETITEAFARIPTSARSTDYDHVVLLDEIAGSLGEAAAVLGATLAGFDEPNRRHSEQFGRGLSTARQIGLVLDTAPSDALVVPPTFNEGQLRTHAEQRRDDAVRALDALSKTVDVTRLRAFTRTTRHTWTSSNTDDDALN